MAKLLQDTAMMDPTALKINMFKCRLIYSWHQKPKKNQIWVFILISTVRLMLNFGSINLNGMKIITENL